MHYFFGTGSGLFGIAVAVAVATAFFVSSLLLLNSLFKAGYLFSPIYGFM